jgi:hypothetical protein
MKSFNVSGKTTAGKAAPCNRKEDNWEDCVDATMESTAGKIIAAIPGGYPAILVSCIGAGPNATC